MRCLSSVALEKVPRLRFAASCSAAEAMMGPLNGPAIVPAGGGERKTDDGGGMFFHGQDEHATVSLAVCGSMTIHHPYASTFFRRHPSTVWNEFGFGTG